MNTSTHFGYVCILQDGVISEKKADEFKTEVDLPRLLLKITVITLLCISSKIRVWLHHHSDITTIYTGITTLLVAGTLFRLYYKSINAKMRIDSGYEHINGSIKDTESIKGSITGSYKDYGSINGSVKDFESSIGSVQSIQFSLTGLNEKYTHEDSQTVRQSLL